MRLMGMGMGMTVLYYSSFASYCGTKTIIHADTCTTPNTIKMNLHVLNTAKLAFD